MTDTPRPARIVDLGGGVILSRRRLARRWTSDAVVPGLAREDILGVGLAAIGAWFSISGLSGAAQMLAYDQPWQAYVGSGSMFLLGVALFLGARTLAGFWRKLREAG